MGYHYYPRRFNTVDEVHTYVKTVHVNILGVMNTLQEQYVFLYDYKSDEEIQALDAEYAVINGLMAAYTTVSECEFWKLVYEKYGRGGFGDDQESWGDAMYEEYVWWAYGKAQGMSAEERAQFDLEFPMYYFEDTIPFHVRCSFHKNGAHCGRLLCDVEYEGEISEYWYRNGHKTGTRSYWRRLDSWSGVPWSLLMGGLQQDAKCLKHYFSHV